MTSYDQGDVVLIPFPFTDLSTFKQRPALVISGSEFNRRRQDIVVAAITSQVPASLPVTDYRLEGADLKTGGLPKASIVKLGKIVTLDQRLIRKRLGTLPKITVAKILSQFHQIFGS
mgnify:CR=1 FL=1